MGQHKDAGSWPTMAGTCTAGLRRGNGKKGKRQNGKTEGKRKRAKLSLPFAFCLFSLGRFPRSYLGSAHLKRSVKPQTLHPSYLGVLSL
jgi:hypothetical protein